MLQFPLSRFSPRRLTTSHRACSQHFRSVLALGLAALLFLAPLSFGVSAQESGTTSKPTQAHQFTLYQDAEGNVVCREATLAELREAESIDPSTQGLRQINHLKREYTDYAHSAKAQTGANGSTGLTIILRATTQLQANQPALNAFNRAAQNWENLIQTPVTVYMDVDFGTTNFGTAWPANVLGSTSTPSHSYPYQSVRTNLIAEATGEGNATKQAIFNALPSTNVPTDLGNASTTDVPDSIARAIGLLNPTALSTDSASRIAFNSNFSYDFDPTDGITPGQTDFDAVATHEIGHALGFDSDAGEGLARPAVWDFYRFRTGTTSATFSTDQRIMTIGGSPDSLQYYLFPDNVNAQQGLSTGGPNGSTTNGGDGWQSSHWKHASQNGGVYVGIMDPAIASGIRRQITSIDALALNSFGYNLNNSVTPPPPPPPPTPPANDNFANAQAISGCSGNVTGTNVGATEEHGEPSHDPAGATGVGSVWYQWQAPSDSSVTITTIGSDYDTLLGVYTGTSVNNLTVIAKNDDIDTRGGNYQSSVTFTASAGTVYKIAVDGYPDDQSIGNIKLNWNASTCSAQTTPTITWNNPADITYGTALSSTQLNATANTSGSFAYTPPFGTFLNAGNGQTLSVTFTPADTTNFTSASKSVLINVLKANQVISFTQPNDQVFGNAPFTLTASATSALPVSFSIDSGPATVSGNTVTLTGVGTVVVRASEAASANFNAAPDVIRSFVVTAAATPPTVQLSASSYSVSKHSSTGQSFATITVNRTGDLSGASTVKYATSDSTDINFRCNPNDPNAAGQPTGIASRKCDYHIAVGRLRFAPGESSKQILVSILDNAYTKGTLTFTITLSNPTGATLGTPITATITITDNGVGGANPIDGTSFFVRQLYVDLLSREPDPAGWSGWISRIDLCGQAGQAPPPCDRVTVGGDGFLRSTEFFDREFFVLRLYRAGLGRIPQYSEVGDLAYVSGFLSSSDLELNKQELVADIMARSEFSTKYNGLGNLAFVDTLLQTANVSVPQSVHDGWVTALNNSSETRAQVYRELSERQEVSDKYLHESQVVSAYYGFFSRNPDGAAYSSYLPRLDSGEINLGDLANAFINSLEYRQRFGPN
jgi:hypothetical protein